MKSSPALRTVLSSVFIFFMLAAGHLLMVVLNAVEYSVDGSTPSGAAARMFTDRPLAEELEAALKKARTPENRAVLQAAISDAHAGRDVRLKMLKVTKTLVISTLALTAIGIVLVWVTSRLKGDAAQTIVGIFGGNFIWTGAVEYGLTIASRQLGVAKAITAVDGQLIAIYGEYVLLKHTWGALVLIMAYLLYLESSRCPVFLWWRERVPTMRGALVTGRIDNYGPRSAFQYATTVWGFYLLLLWAYDEDVFGVHGVFTNLVMVGSLAGTLYTVYRLNQYTGWGPAIRYAMGAMIIAWTPIEIAGKWGVLREPWLLLHPSTLVIFFGGLALGTWMLWRAQRRPRQDLVGAS
ncbi:MAG: hypothetical protein DI536_14380 [Archangium gephyra]|uniref:Uncharacterized protein n=1 Tax=Archangium gephyra TaxID=48 RepID=A0A2W5VA54_9BACT|nr:MAG: hypothetical protein DI536_14380 [Archangium gephyra]